MSTYTPIASVTLSSAQSSVTFSGIPQTYTDLVVVASVNESNDVAVKLNFNSDTGSNYSFTSLYGTGSTAGSDRASSQTYTDLGRYYDATSTTRPIIILNVMNYTNSTTNKTFLIRGTTPGLATQARVGLWRSTSAITSLDLAPTSGTFSSGSTFNLYGVANASITNTAKATGGDSVTTDGTYWYHTFRSSGTFTPTQALTADYLVVAGGGGGGGGTGGGGGAGGLRSTVTATGGGGSLESPLSLALDTSYTVTVGAGGSSTVFDGNNGSNSVFSTITATGGGGGGSNSGGSSNGKTGGSGGGGVYGATGGTGTTNQGYAGGLGGDSATNYPGGGGGGAGAVGANATGATVAGNGGAGVAVSITGSSVNYAGGGGGGTFSGGTTGTGGLGGGGNADSAGTANTGGGGGGDINNGAIGGNGGSGIVIVRYAV